MQPIYCDCEGFHDGSCHEREIERLREALRPFAKLQPSSLFDNQYDDPGYMVVLVDYEVKPDFTRVDLIRAAMALKGDE